MKLLTTHLTLLLSLAVAGAFFLLWQQGFSLRQNWEHYQDAQRQSKKLAAAPVLLSQQEALLKELDAKARNGASGSALDLATYLEELCQATQVRLTVLPWESQAPATAGYDLHCTHFSLQGSFSGILEVLYQLERSGKAGALSYLRMAQQTFRRDKKSLPRVQATLEFTRLIPHSPKP